MDRRTFLASLASGSMLPDKRALTLGFSTYGLPGMPLDRALRLLATTGFDSVELSLLPGSEGDPLRLGMSRRKEIRKILVDLGLSLPALMENLSPSPLARTHREALERLTRAAQLAHDLSPDAPPLIETVLGSGDWEKRKTLYRDRLGDWVRVMAYQRIRLAIKPHRFGAMSLPEQAIWLIDQLGVRRWLGLVFDPSHYALRGLDMDALVDQAAPRTLLVAVKDVSMEKGKVKFYLPGTKGSTDYAALLRRLDAAGYRGDINCEVSGMVSGQKDYNPEQAVRICHAHMHRAMVQAGLRR